MKLNERCCCSCSSHAHIMYCSLIANPSTNGTFHGFSDMVGRVGRIWPDSAAPVNVAKYISSTASVLVPGRLQAPTPRPDNVARQSTQQVILGVCTCSLRWPQKHDLNLQVIPKHGIYTKIAFCMHHASATTKDTCCVLWHITMESHRPAMAFRTP